MKRWIPGVAVVMLAVLGLALLAGCEVSTASLSSVNMCTNPESDGTCTNDDTTFKVSDPVIYLSAKLDNAPSGTKVTATWKFLGNRDIQAQDIDSVTAEAKESGSMPFFSSLDQPTNGWPKGNYEVDLTLTSDNSTPVSKQFSIE